MDGYPLHCVAHNLPFILLSGLEVASVDSHGDEIEAKYPCLRDKGIPISSELPLVTGPVADDLVRCFDELDARDAAWNSRPGKGKMGSMGFTFRHVGRAFKLPPHKADLPESLDEPVPGSKPGRRLSSLPVLHSPLSPLSPISPVYPDGIMTPLWFSKHQMLLPAAVMAFFNFTLDSGSSTLQDNKLKTDIGAVRSAMLASGYKLRFIAVLVSEPGAPTNAAERVGNIRRGTSLDTKSLFFLPGDLSLEETKAFVGTALAATQPLFLDYYRDLSKHARRKKSRSSVPLPTAPPISGTSQTLSQRGWDVRYETKLGFFAECRQEMDAAGRSYESAYEALMDGDVFESVSSWSPRFNETRLLADVLAFRILRCLLWSGQTTAAAQSWSNHRYRIQNMVDRRGKGSGTYGWHAWEARWSAAMGELIERVDLPVFHVSDYPSDKSSLVPRVYAPSEKAIPQEESTTPWGMLHHEGYWYRRSAQSTDLRRRLALAIPQEDRAGPGQTPASQIASRAHSYDTYLCPEPHLEYGLPGQPTFDHGRFIVDILGRSGRQFARRGQRSTAESVQLAILHEHMRAGRWKEAMDLAKPLWQKLSWRRAGWWLLLEETGWALRACARQLGDGITLLAVEWELQSSLLTQRTYRHYDFSRCLDDLDIKERPHVVVESDSTAPCLSATFAFGTSIGRVGDILASQLVVTSHAHPSSTPIVLSKIVVSLDGKFGDVHITHSSDVDVRQPVEGPGLEIIDVALEEVQPSSSEPAVPGASDSQSKILSGKLDLSFAPATTKVFALSLMPRETGEVRAEKVVLSIHEEAFHFDLDVTLRSSTPPANWWFQSEGQATKRRLDTKRSCSVTIMPRPPRIQIELPALRKAYYTDRQNTVKVLLTNGEDEETDTRLTVRFLGSAEKMPSIRWTSKADEGEPGLGKDATAPPSDILVLGRLTAGEERAEVFTISPLLETVDFELELRADYQLASDPDTILSKTVTTDVNAIRPFEATYDFSSRIHTDTWPSYFHLAEEPADLGCGPAAQGLCQKWSVVAKLASFAKEPLILESILLKVVSAKEDCVCRILNGGDERSSAAVKMAAHDFLDRAFEFEVQKLTLEDRGPAAVEFVLVVAWRRPDERADEATVSSLVVPNFAVPFSKPRVLASARPSRSHPPLIHVTYTLENPSAYLLTFSLSMEASEEFAFSGPKATSVQLVPLSRHAARFNLWPTARGVWIRPALKVLDVGFGQVLPVQAADGCKAEKKGLAIWIDAE